jgi:selenide,water dikinase
MHASLPKHDVVLLGIGHTNAHVLRMWKMQPIDDARLTCISNFSVATYSGMLPGTLAGQYPPSRMEIDLVRLCAAVGARLIVDEVKGLDVAGQRVLFAERPPVPFDVLSIGIGSVPTQDGVELPDETALPIKPMQTFLERLEMRLTQLRERDSSSPLRVAIVGAGAGGVEIAFCLPAGVADILGTVPLELTLVNSHETLITGTTEKTARKAKQQLELRGVRLLLGKRVMRVAEGVVTLSDGEQLEADLVVWATSASRTPLLGDLDLPTDERGFLLTHRTLQTTADAPIFAVGDSGTIAGHRTAKAGVYAVRQGPILWENIHRAIEQRPLIEYRPQRDFLKLFNTGDGGAIGEYKGLSFVSGWAWRLKDAIDGKFMDKYQDYSPMPMSRSAAGDGNAAMRCAGCGGKVGGSVLSKVLERLEVPPSEHVLLGLDQPDDAAIVRPPSGRPITLTVDFFAAPLDDPYLVGRIAALNAASDVFALGAQPLAALASATIPVGRPRKQEQLLYELLAGGLEEFRRMGATLVGGHTIEGPQLTIGFTMVADQGDENPLTKSGLRVGDRLILTKPIGTGVLLAAHMQARCEAEWMESLLPTMLLSNRDAASLVDDFDISGLTDVTGFGLAGHLLEMLRASNVGSVLELEALPLLPGVHELTGEGLESTLVPANRTVEADMQASESCRKHPGYSALFDPQTSGGLLLGVRESEVKAVLERLAGQSEIEAAAIGHVCEHDQARRRLKVIAGH